MVMGKYNKMKLKKINITYNILNMLSLYESIIGNF